MGRRDTNAFLHIAGKISGAVVRAAANAVNATVRAGTTGAVVAAICVAAMRAPGRRAAGVIRANIAIVTPEGTGYAGANTGGADVVRRTRRGSRLGPARL